VILTDESEEYSGKSFGTPSQKNGYGQIKKKGCRLVVIDTIANFYQPEKSTVALPHDQFSGP
jgi:hypothetical protein